MKIKIIFIIVFTVFISTNCIYAQQNNELDIEGYKGESSKRISIYTEPVEGVYKNFWYAYKLDNGELILFSEGKTKEIRSSILFNCQNNKYILYSSTNFGYNISEEEFKELVPKTVINLSRKIMCNQNN